MVRANRIKTAAVPALRMIVGEPTGSTDIVERRRGSLPSLAWQDHSSWNKVF